MIHHKTTTMTNCKSTRNWHSIRVCCSIVASISTTLILCGRGCSTGNNFLFRTTTNQSSKTMMLDHSSLRGRKVDSIEQMKEFLENHRHLGDFTWPPTQDPFPENFQPAGPSSNLTPDGKINSDSTFPAVMVAVASSVIVCAVGLYLSDMRDRCRHQYMLDHYYCNQGVKHSSRQQPWRWRFWCGRRISDLERSGGFPRLPPCSSPEEQQLEAVEEISISPVSTMTASVAMEQQSLERVDSDLYLAQSTDIQELADVDRLSGGMDFSSLVDDLSQIQAMASFVEPEQMDHTSSVVSQGSKSLSPTQESSRRIRIDDTLYIMSDKEEDESSWTGLPGDSYASSDVSIGTYLKSVHSGKSRSSSMHSMGNLSTNFPVESRDENCDGILDQSPDRQSLEYEEDGEKGTYFTQLDGTGHYETEAKLSLLEEMLERNRPPIQEYKGQDSTDESTDIHDSLGPDYVRNIFYIPLCPSIASSNAIGIDVADGTCTPGFGPGVVTSIHSESPFRGRIFEGDVILAVNNQQTNGLGAKETRLLTVVGRDTTNGEPSMADVIKLTVLSANPDGSDTSNSGSEYGSMDTGMESSAIEV